MIARVYKRIGVDAINVGELDLVLGVGFLQELQRTQDVTLISANLVNEKNVPIFQPYVVKQIDGKKILVLGLTGDAPDMVSKVKKYTGGRLGVQDPVRAAEAIVKELSGKVDIVVALTHQGTARDWVLAGRVPGIDVIVGGHDKQKTRQPWQFEKTYIVQSGEKGQYQGMLELSLQTDGTKTAKNTLVPLGDDIAADSQVTSWISEYNKRIADMFAPPESVAKSVFANLPLKDTECETCHEEEMAQWKNTDHARAYDTLIERSKQYDPDCLPCHTTRFEQPEGFSMKLQKLELVNIQCDSCHGLGSEHAVDGKPIPVPNPGQEVCVGCHTSDRSPNFEKDYEQEYQKIKH